MKNTSSFLLAIIITASILNISAPAFSEDDFEKAFTGFLLGTSAPQNQQHIATPGEIMLQSEDCTIYYAGYEYSAGGNKILYLQILTASSSIPLRFPNPDIIKVRSNTLKIVDFDSTKITFQSLRYNP